MNCFRAQQLLSPYLDQQLAGVEMLEIQRHLSECGLCAEEYQSARQVKTLLRSLSLPRSEAALEERILSRLAQEERRSGSLLPTREALSALPALWPPVPMLPISLPPPNRVRRLTGALALSCLAVFAVAAPFAPSTPRGPIVAEDAALGQAASVSPMPNAGLRAAPADGGLWMRPVSVDTADPSDRRGSVNAQRDFQPPLTDAGSEPLDDEAAGGYVSSDVAFVGYHVR